MSRERILKAIYDQKQRIADDKAAWSRLKALAASGDLPGFYRAYAGYLRANEVVSERREMLIGVFEATAKHIDG